MGKIAVGSTLPSQKVKVNEEERDIKELFANKKGVLFALPGAFTPTCSSKHVPGFRDQVDKLKSKGVDTVACVSVNDSFVMKAWAKDLSVSTDKILMCADGNADFTKAIGMEQDLSKNCMGTRSMRYAMIVEAGGKVAWIGEDDDSFVEKVLENL